ncbi:MAG: oxaloacetate decarboxylase [Lautropia sp.]
MRQSARLRKHLAGGQVLFIPGCFNAMSARVLENAGFPVLYAGGYAASLSLAGMPDVGLLTMTEMLMHARYIVNAARVPVIADADTGYGNAVNVARTVREFIAAGVAGIHLEDQESPKRCGHVAGKTVLPIDEAVGKFRAADAVRRELDPDFLLVARTDARGARGGSLDEAIERGNTYLAAGADMVFVEGPVDTGEVHRICTEVRGPVFYNMTGVSPRFTLAQMQEMGIAICISSLTLARASLMAMHDIAVRLRDEGPMAELDFFAGFDKHAIGNLHAFAGFDEVRRLEEAYLPKEALEKYQGSVGYLPRSGAD